MQTKIRLLVLPLILSAATLAAETTPGSGLHGGKIWLDLAPDQISTLGINTATLAAALCDPLAMHVGLGARGGGGSEDCRLVVGGSGSQSRSLAVEITVLTYTPRAGTRAGEVAVRVTDLALQGAETFLTPCGEWSFDVHLRPGALQARNDLILEAPPVAGASGLFVGTLRMATEILFVEPDLGLAVAVDLDLELDAAGRWAFLPAGAAAAGESDLALFVDQGSQGARERAGCAQDRHRCGLLCLTARESTVDLMNGIVP